VAAGIKPPKPIPPPPEKYIIPPDPAVVLGQREPGEHVIVESNKHRNGRNGKLIKHSKTMSDFFQEKGEGSGGSYGKLGRRGTEPFSRRPEDVDHPVANADT
jgi:hypothetical protein